MYRAAAAYSYIFFPFLKKPQLSAYLKSLFAASILNQIKFTLYRMWLEFQVSEQGLEFYLLPFLISFDLKVH